MRRITLILTLALLIIALTAAMALAMDADNIWVNNVKIVNDGVYNSSHNISGVSYDRSSNTLTLDGAHITAGYKFGEDYISYYAGIYADGDLDIVLAGENSIELSVDVNLYYGIRIKGGDLTVSGGSLSISTCDRGIYLSLGDIAIDNSELSITADYYDGIYAVGNVAITDSDLNITAKGDGDGFGIYSEDDSITIDNSDLTITAGEGGISALNGDITIDNSELNIKAGQDGFDTYNNITVTDSELNITAGDDGICAYDNITITDSELTVTADYDGIYTLNGDITISDSYVVSKGGEIASGIYAGGIIDISNSYVYAEGGEAGMFAHHWDEDRNTISTSDGIVYEGVIVTQGGKVVTVYDEGDLSGYTFSETQQRVTEELLEDETPIFPGAAQIVELVPTAEVMQLVAPIISGVGKNFPFVDVGLNHWAYNDIFDAFKKGLINGKTETLYLPDGPLTYAEAIKLAACIHQLNSMGAVSFEASDPWYQTYVSYAELNQIILPGEFSGQMNDAIIRYDFAHIFGKALPLSAFAPINDISSIPDVPSSNRHADEILMLYRAGILVGSDAAGNFYGNSNIKRSEVAAIVVRMIDPARRIVK